MWVSATVFYNVLIIKELERVLPQTFVNLSKDDTRGSEPSFSQGVNNEQVTKPRVPNPQEKQKVRNRSFPKQLYYKDLQSQWFLTSPTGLVKASQDEKRPVKTGLKSSN